MLVTRDQPGRRGAISSSVRQRSSHSVQPGVFQGSATHQFTQESRINTPLNFPQPTFGTARIVDPVGQGDGLRIPRYIIVSEESGRGWAVVDSIRDCQFGQVQRGVQVTRTSSGRWTSSTTPPFYVAIKELRFSKMVDMQGRSHEDPLREVATLQYLSDAAHPNVLQCIETLKDDNGIYIVMPYCSGGEIFDVVAERDYLGEDEARSIFRQALDGLLFLKPYGVCHRDVSLENMMLDAEGVLKIIDFGLALRVPQGADGEALPLSPQEVCGKRFYMAPEVMSRSGTFDGFAVDVWACGVMLFVMLTGIPPFEFALPSLDKRCRVIAVEERLGELLEVWGFQISPQAVDLMQSCLTYDPARRPRLEDLRVHPWLDSEP